MSTSFPLSPPLDLPSPLPLKKMLGPSFILLGLGLGSGEIILWPYLASNHGLGLVWAIIAGISMQFLINTEVERYALVFGESIFVGFARWLKILPLWFIFSTFLGFGWPGIGLAGATLLSHVFSFPYIPLLSIILFIVFGLVLSLGKHLYQTVETLEKYFILVGTPFIFILVLWLAKTTDWQALFQGLIGVGQKYRFLPVDISMTAFLGALAFAGAGGNLNLAQSFYIRDKGYGMGKFSSPIKSIFTARSADTVVNLAGRTFPLTTDNLSRFRLWWHRINLEHGLVFWGLGSLTILLLALLAYITAFGHPDNPEGIRFVLTEALAIGQKTLPLIGSLFLVVTGLMLSATQLTVLDSTSRIITENLILFRGAPSGRVSRIYYLVLWFQIIFGIVILSSGLAQPRQLITTAAVFNAVTMFVYTILIFYLNNTRLPKPLRPSLIRNICLLSTFLFFGFFCFQTLAQIIKN